MSKFHYRESPSLKQREAFKKYLSEDEELILVTGLSSAYLRNRFATYFLFPGMVFLLAGFSLGWIISIDKGYALLLGLGLALLGAYLQTLHQFHSNRYLFTTRRVIIKKGVFTVKLTAALFDKITHLEVDQRFLDRLLFHHGDIIVNTAGMNKGEIILKYVDSPLELKNLLERLINREREHFGLRAAPLSTVEGEVLE